MQVLKRFSALGLAFILMLIIAYISAAPVEADETYYTTIEEAGARLREMMKNRISKMTIYFQSEDADANEIATAIYEEALRHTGVPDEGDYLRWQEQSFGYQTDVETRGGISYITISYDIEFRTTAEQEKEVDAAVEALLAELDIQNTSDYRKIRAIYNWITKSVIYDYAHVGDRSYLPQYTAYGALLNRTAVCQGYALLLYRLALEVGIDCRIVTGYAGENHGWNIVKIENAYYNLDATWDAGNGTNWFYFLKCQESFQDHLRDDIYDIPEFHVLYPMGDEDYVYTWQYETEDGFGYTVHNNEAIIDDYFGSAVDVVIPEQIDGYPVTLIGSQAFYDHDDIVSVSLPATVRRIEDGGAFQDCDNLITLTIPENAQLEYIGEWSFNCCEKLESVTLPASIRVLALSCFEGCHSLKELRLPEGLEKVCQNAIGGTSVTTIHIPSTCTYFHEFNSPETLCSFTVASGNLVYCTHEGVLYTNNCEQIFGGNTDVSGWTLMIYPQQKPSAEYTVPDFCEHIYGWAFLCEPDMLSQLKTLYIQDCDGLSDVYLLGENTISRIRCRIVPAQTNPYYQSVDGMLLSKDGKTLLQIPATLSDPVIVPNGVTTIALFAGERGHFTKVVLPEGVTNIDMGSFWQHQGELSIYLPKSLETYDTSAFTQCQSDPVFYYGGTKSEWLEVEVRNDWYFKITPHYYSVDVNDCSYGLMPHDWEVIEYAEATCSSEGYQLVRCSECNHEESQVIPKKEHQYSDDATIVAPECVKKGYTSYVCIICGHEHKEDYVEGTGHQYGEWYNISEVAEDGTVKQRHDCNVCGFSMTRQTTYIEEPSEPVATSSETGPQAEPVIWPYFVATAVLACAAVGVTFAGKKRKNTTENTET